MKLYGTYLEGGFDAAAAAIASFAAAFFATLVSSSRRSRPRVGGGSVLLFAAALGEGFGGVGIPPSSSDCVVPHSSVLLSASFTGTDNFGSISSIFFCRILRRVAWLADEGVVGRFEGGFGLVCWAILTFISPSTVARWGAVGGGFGFWAVGGGFAMGAALLGGSLAGGGRGGGIGTFEGGLGGIATGDGGMGGITVFEGGSGGGVLGGPSASSESELANSGGGGMKGIDKSSPLS